MAKAQKYIYDQILVIDAQDGNVKAMEMLISRWQKRLWYHAFWLTDDKNGAWDITQESWLGIIKGLKKLHNPANFRAWAYKITTNKTMDWLRKNKAVKQISIEEIQECQHEEEKEIGLKELFGKLKLKKRVVLNLYYFEQLSISEISIALNIPKGTVKSRLHKAKNELKELWQKHNEKLEF